jgi:uncharacterized protein YciI
VSVRASGPLCVVVLTYVRPLADVDALMAEHVAWLEAGFADGTLLVAGRQEPRTGGVILARGRRAEVEALAAGDPFVAGGVATAAVTQFNASFAVPALAERLA